jgi:hypothetical protein
VPRAPLGNGGGTNNPSGPPNANATAPVANLTDLMFGGGVSRGMFPALASAGNNEDVPPSNYIRNFGVGYHKLVGTTGKKHGVQVVIVHLPSGVGSGESLHDVKYKVSTCGKYHMHGTCSIC